MKWIIDAEWVRGQHLNYDIHLTLLGITLPLAAWLLFFACIVVACHVRRGKMRLQGKGFVAVSMLVGVLQLVILIPFFFSMNEATHRLKPGRPQRWSITTTRSPTLPIFAKEILGNSGSSEKKKRLPGSYTNKCILRQNKPQCEEFDGLTELPEGICPLGNGNFSSRVPENGREGMIKVFLERMQLRKATS